MRGLGSGVWGCHPGPQTPHDGCSRLSHSRPKCPCSKIAQPRGAPLPGVGVHGPVFLDGNAR